MGAATQSRNFFAFLHAHVHAITHTCTHTYMQSHIPTNTNACTHTYMQSHIPTNTNAHFAHKNTYAIEKNKKKKHTHLKHVVAHGRSDPVAKLLRLLVGEARLSALAVLEVLLACHHLRGSHHSVSIKNIRCKKEQKTCVQSLRENCGVI